MKNKIQVFLLSISLVLNFYLMIVTITLDNNIANIEEETKKINRTIEVQNKVIVEMQQDFDELKNQKDK